MLPIVKIVFIVKIKQIIEERLNVRHNLYFFTFGHKNR
jgi:hypothetical protein